MGFQEVLLGAIIVESNVAHHPGKDVSKHFSNLALRYLLRDVNP